MYPVITQKLLDHPLAVLGILRRAAIEAGSAIMSHYDPSGFHGEVSFKADNSPVTPADLEADSIIRRILEDQFSGIPMVTEETAHQVDRTRLLSARHYWLVDGLDGTRAFRAGDSDFTVNIALIEDQTPIIGVVYAPAHGEGFMGMVCENPVALRWRDETEGEEEIRARPAPREGLTFLTSKTEQLSHYAQSLMDQVKVSRHIKRSSSIKYTEIAAGRADLLVTTRAMHYWDTAAGDVIIRAAGGFILRLDGTAVRYDPAKESLTNQGLLACGDLSYIKPVMNELRALCS